jgi:peptidase M28-like protein
MRPPRLTLAAALLALASCSAPPPGARRPAEASLAALATDPEPWLPFVQNSDLRQPVYLGARPVDMVLDRHKAGHASVQDGLRRLGEAQLAAVARRLDPGGSGVEVEAWPAEDDYGWELTWALARWRRPGEIWHWLDRADLPDAEQPDHDLPALLPLTLRPADPNDWTRIFADFMDLPSLYDRPVFSECLFTDPAGGSVFEAWRPPEERERLGRVLAAGSRAASERVCRALRQPARVDARPVSFVVRVHAGQVNWPAELSWTSDQAPQAEPVRSTPRIKRWPAGFSEAYHRDLLALDGEVEAVFPRSGRRMRFTRKNSAQADHQLEDVAEYLEERYRELGVPTRRQSFVWRGLHETNLIAVIAGRPDAGNRPVLLADHVDTAFAETLFMQTGRRVSVPGADDNASATATLLRAAAILHSARLRHDLWLVHLTGEEYPGDDLGARHLAEELLRDRRRVGAILLLDMIAYHPGPAEGALFQVNAGDSAASVELARVALGSAADVAPQLQAAFRDRFSRKSYLYNTDGHIFSQLGYPVLLFNEHLNALENLDRPHYHEMTDTSDKLNWDYALSIARVAIETAARLADAQGPIDPP